MFHVFKWIVTVSFKKTLLKLKCNGLNTLCIVSLAFLIFLIFFSCVFTHVLDTNMLISKMQVKTQEEKITQREPNARKLHYALGKNASWLRFFSRFGTFEVTKMQTQPIV